MEQALIDAEKFHAYCKVQFGGKTNMFFVNNVIALSGHVLNEEDIGDIMKNYSKYEVEFGTGQKRNLR